MDSPNFIAQLDAIQPSRSSQALHAAGTTVVSTTPKDKEPQREPSKELPREPHKDQKESAKEASKDAAKQVHAETTNNPPNNSDAEPPKTTQPDALASVITQVKQPAAPAKPALDAAKKRVAKLDLATPKQPQQTAQSDQKDADADQPSSKTPLPPSPHTTAALSAAQSNNQPLPIAALAAAKSKKRRSPAAAFWSTIFPCCCSPIDDDHAAVQMSTVSKNPSATISKQPSQQPQQSPKPKAAQPVEPKKWLLKPLASEDIGKKCLVLDLDETLVHSSFKPVAKADFVIPVEIDKTIHNVYVLKRPGVDTFLQRLGPQFEVVVFTASLSKYADPVLDMLDKHKVVKHRLFREACIHHKGNYVKDLNLLGRDLKDVIIIDNSPSCYMFHPANAIPISSWFDDPSDTELLDLIPFLEDLKLVENVTAVLDNSLDD